MGIFPSLCKRRALFAKKVFSLVLLLGLIVQPIAPSFFMSGFFISKAQAADESAAMASVDEEDVTEETEEVKTETIEEEKTVSQPEETVLPETPVEEVVAPESETPEVTVVEEEKAEEVAPSEAEATPTEEKKEVTVWQTEGDKATTASPVALGVKYEAPQNKEVSVTFTKLPETPGTLTIEEITLTEEQIAQTGSLSDKAYDITSSMENGSFEYELTLPIPEGQKDVQIKYADDAEGLKDAHTINTSDVKQEGDSVTAELDHFTIFVTVATYQSGALTIAKTNYLPGQTVFTEAEIGILEYGLYHRLDIVEPNGTKHQIAACTKNTLSLTGSYVLSLGAELGTDWEVRSSTHLTNFGCQNNITLAAVSEQAFTVGIPTVVYVSSGYTPAGVNGGHTWGYDAFDSLQNALDTVAPAGTVIMESDVTVTSRALINKSLTLDGNNHTLNSGYVWSSNSNNAGIGIMGANAVTIKDLIVDGGGNANSLHGINVYESTNVSIDGVTVQNNGRSGLVVNSSEVSVNNIVTANNGWHGINVDYVTQHTELTVNGASTHTNEPLGFLHIYVDNRAEDVVVNDVTGQYSVIQGVLNSNDRVYTLTPPDTTKPFTEVLSPVEYTYFGNTPFNINIRSTDTESGIALAVANYYNSSNTFLGTCVNHAVSPTETVHNFTCTINPSSLSAGTYYIKTNAKDAAGNLSNTVTWRFKIDKTKPVTQVLSPVNNSIQNAPFSIAIQSIDGESGIAKAVANIYNGSNTLLGTCVNQIVNPAVPTYNFTCNINTNTLSDGNYYIKTNALDAAGNMSNTVTWNFVIDKTAPVAPTLNTPVDGFATKGVAFSQKWFPVADATQYEYQSCYNDPGDAGAACSSVKWSELFTGTTKNVGAGQPTGEFWWRVRAKDAANNWSVWSESRHLMIDNDKPSSIITTFGVTNGGTVETPTWDGLIEGTAVDNLSGVHHVNLVIKRNLFSTPGVDEYWNGTDWQATEVEVTATGDDSWSYALPAPIDGTYTVASHAVDNAGNVESTYTITIILDKTIPEVSLVINPSNPNGNSNWYVTEPVITLAANDNYHVDYIEYQLNGTGGAWTTYSGPVTITDGTWQFYYRAVDTVGNVSGIGVKNVKVDTQDPDEVNNLDAEYRSEQDDIKLTWDVDDNDIDKVYIYRGGSRNFSINSGNKVAENNANDDTYSDNNPELGETYYYKLVSVDEAGNRSGAKVIKVEMPENEGGTATVTNEGADAVADGTVLGAQTDANAEGQGEENGDQGGTVTEEGSVLGAATENGDTNGIMDFMKKNWWWLILLLIALGYATYKQYVKSKKQTPLV